MTTLREVFDVLQRLRPRLEARGVVRIGVFGSVARGAAGPDSDVDFLVTLAERASLFDLVAIRAILSEELGRRVDVVSEAGLKPDVRDAVLRDVRYAA